MGKKKKKNLGIKTSRYFTKKCSSCGYEYPNWFVSCPKCGASWDESLSLKEASIKKNVKILARFTEEDFEKPINKVNLIFSGDFGKSWYKIKMDFESDYYMGQIAEVPKGANIIYYIEVELIDGEKIIENNEGKFFNYQVGSVGLEDKLPPQKDLEEEMSKEQKSTPPPPKTYFKPAEKKVPDTISKPSMEINKKAKEYIEEPKEISQGSASFTIFGNPQTEKETDLKICPNCNSKIKNMWSVCPICGHIF